MLTELILLAPVSVHGTPRSVVGFSVLRGCGGEPGVLAVVEPEGAQELSALRHIGGRSLQLAPTSLMKNLMRIQSPDC